MPQPTRSTHRARRSMLLLAALALLVLAGSSLLAGCTDEDEQFVQDIQDELSDPDEDTPQALLDRAEDYLDVRQVEVEVAPRVLHAIAAIGGLVLLVVGWRIYRFMVSLPGLLLGGLIGVRLGAPEGEVIAIVGLMIGAGLGSLLGMVLHDTVVFGVGAYIGAGLALRLIDGDPTLITLIAGLIGGVLFVALFYRLLVVVTAAIGALLMGYGLGAGLGVMLGLFAVGLLVQINLARIMGEPRPLRPARRTRPAGG